MAKSTYDRRAEQLDDERQAHLHRGERIGWARVCCALAAVAACVAGWDGRLLTWPASLALAAALGGGFLVGVAWHRQVRSAARRAEILASLNRQGAARVERRWRQLPLPAAPEQLALAPLAIDLDLFGRASLFQLLCTAHTPRGRSTLAGWLLEPASPETVLARQVAVRELAAALDWRQELEYRGLKDGESFAEPASFLAWAEGPRWLAGRTALSWYSVLAPALLALLAALQGAGLAAGPWWAIIVLTNLAVTMFIVRPIHAIFSRISTGERSFARYAWMIECVNRATFKSPQLLSLQERLRADRRDAAARLNALQRDVTLADLRSQMIYGPIQALTLWDVHVLRRLERWQYTAGGHVRDWLAALAEMEALASLAALAHAEPTWVAPAFHDSPRLSAIQLGHPLLPGQARVANDVELGPPGTFLLVTGSNMSGKSTLLRSIGVNVMLAQAGGPVCAAGLTLPSLRMGTSMRVQDSLEEATSYFLAELKRLKQIVDAASAEGATFLYLLDEILHGTNSRERRIAVQAVLSRLLAQRAIGAVSTHDLDLADAPTLKAAATAVHFREVILPTPQGRSMSFDYRMHPGLATTTNALVLLESMGLAPTTER